MTNYHPETGIRFGVISMQNIDQDIASELWHGPGAVDLTWEEVRKQTRLEVEAEVQGEINEGVLDPEEEESEVEHRVERRLEQTDVSESDIEGTYQGVKYGISWLGGAPLLWVYEGPVGMARSLCSPCAPGAADLDSGFVLSSEEPNVGGYECYVVPRDWLWEPK